MNWSPELIWFLAGLVLMLAELAVPGVVLVFFGMGALVTALAAWLGLQGLAPQAGVFVGASLIFLFGLRRLVKRWFLGDSKDRDAGMLEEFVGKDVVVLSDIPGGAATGKVQLKGAEWMARAEAALPKGSCAVVRARDGLVLVVAPR